MLFHREISLPLQDKSLWLDSGYRIDVLVENRSIVESKHLEEINSMHDDPCLTYMRLAQVKYRSPIHSNVTEWKAAALDRNERLGFVTNPSVLVAVCCTQRDYNAQVFAWKSYGFPQAGEGHGVAETRHLAILAGFAVAVDTPFRGRMQHIQSA